MQSQSLSRVAGRVGKHQVGYLCVLLVLCTGCATFDQRAGFPDVKTVAEARSGKRVVWNLGTELDAQVALEVHMLLQETLTAETAVQVALLNSRTLQALYADMGVAQADLVQAGLLKNPVFDGALRYALHSIPDRLELELNVVLDFLDIFYLPLRKRVAAARFEDAKLQVTGAVLDFAATVRAAFYRHQANEQSLELLQTIVQALIVSLDVAQRLHAAGNITDLSLTRERVLLEEEKLQLRVAETAVRQSREQLNTFMGLWGQQTAWHTARRLPDIPSQALPLDGLETQVLRQSLDLASARQRMIVAGEQVGFNRATALFPDVALGGGGEFKEGGWEVGPVLHFPIPLFDQGQARIGRAITELRRTQQEYYALGVRVRATARAVRELLQGAQDRTLYYRDILLPLLERVVNETQLQYNAMQLGVFDLLRAREQQIRAAIASIDTLRDYWLARTDLEQLLNGRLPSPNGAAMSRMERPKTMGENGGH